MNMKKTLIALAVAASAAISGSAMAWEANGSGGSVNIGGLLTPTENITPWEVKTGAAVTGLDAEISKGTSTAYIPVDKAIPVLGIRVADATNKVFEGGVPDILPRIDYQGVIDVNAFNGGVVPVRLEIKDEQGTAIGNIVVDMLAYGESSWEDTLSGQGPGKKRLTASDAGDAFFGGLGKNESAAILGTDQYYRIRAVDPEFVANFTDFGNQKFTSPSGEKFDKSLNYSAFYGSGIEKNKVIKLTLTEPAAGDAPVIWNASLPVTVSYQ